METKLIIAKDYDETELMNIYALRGHRVMVTEKTSQNGEEFQRELVKKHLKIGQTYLVESTVVGGCKTTVYLQNFPHIGFNSVCFVDVETQAEEDDKKHPDYWTYNS